MVRPSLENLIRSVHYVLEEDRCLSLVFDRVPSDLLHHLHPTPYCELFFVFELYQGLQAGVKLGLNAGFVILYQVLVPYLGRSFQPGPEHFGGEVVIQHVRALK